ncbi:hypothetical protein OF83DRAFT_1100752 [Amylostereum chailletii]|nr:hypothetical protein OF83DRAFT_1100752 [Amylostereum chailletii]
MRTIPFLETSTCIIAVFLTQEALSCAYIPPTFVTCFKVTWFTANREWRYGCTSLEKNMAFVLNDVRQSFEPIDVDSKYRAAELTLGGAQP